MTRKFGLFGKFLFNIKDNFLLSSLLLAALIFFKPVNISAQNTFTKVGQWGWGPTYNLAANGNYAYIGNGYLLQVLDVSDPANPKIAGELLTSSLVFTVTLSGNYIYTTSPFRIIDVSNPANPILVSTYNLPSGFPPSSAVTVEGNYAYVGDYAGNIYIIDVSNPSNPQTLGQMRFPSDGVISIAVKDTVLYANFIDSPGIDAFDISNPSSPSSIGLFGNNIGGLLTTSGKYLCNGAGIYLVMYDISNPANPNYITELAIDRLGGYVNHISIADTIAYVTLASDRFAAVDIANENNIHIISYLNNPFDAPGLETAGEAVNFPYAYIATDDGMWTVNAANPELMSSVSFFPTGGYVNKMTVDSSYHAYLAELSAGLRILDFSDPAAPKLVGYYLTNEQVIDVAVSGGYAYLDCDSDLQGIDVSNLQSPKFISRLSFNDTIAGGYSDFLCLVDSTILAARKSKKLFAIDVGNPSNPEIKSTYSMRGIPVGISISNDYLYVADSDTGIQIFNVSDPYALNEVGFYKMISLRGLTIAKEELFAIGGEEIGPGKQGFVGYDITNPLSPTLKYILNIPGGISVVDLKNESNIAYLAYNNTFIAVDISNPDTGKIVYLGDAYTDPNTPGAGTFNSVALFNGTVLTGYLGVTVFNNAATSVKEKHNTLPDSFELFQNYPNPFNPSTVIKYQLPSAGYVTLTIYDILGRKVDRLINKFQNAGNYTTLFEASKLSSGVYFYRLKVVNIDGEKYTLTKKMELLK